MNERIFISQSKYAKNLVKKFGLENAKCVKTPMGTNDKLSKDENVFLLILHSLGVRLEVCYT